MLVCRRGRCSGYRCAGRYWRFLRIQRSTGPRGALQRCRGSETLSSDSAADSPEEVNLPEVVIESVECNKRRKYWHQPTTPERNLNCGAGQWDTERILLRTQILVAPLTVAWPKKWLRSDVRLTMIGLRERKISMKDENSIALARHESFAVARVDTPTTPIVAVVEDDERFREALVFQLATAGFHLESYPSAESFLEASDFKNCDCIIADICLPRMNGLQLLAEIRQSISYASIILVTGYNDISVGVQAMRGGAVDCLEKPIDDQTLLETVGRAADLSRKKRADNLYRLELQEREETLTPREREVFALVAGGLLNKQVGAMLGATERTIKTHRGRVMNKMNAESLADLVRMADSLRIHPIFRGLPRADLQNPRSGEWSV
jgi:FixJ family two-component response regulator